MSDTWDAWLAGFLDGEGCIRIQHSEPRIGARQRCSPIVTIANTDRTVLDEIRRREGAIVYDIKRYGRNHKPGYEWKMSSPEGIRALLGRLRPYLRVKETEAWLMLEFLEQRTVIKSGTGYRRPLSEEEQALRLGFKLALEIAKC